MATYCYRCSCGDEAEQDFPIGEQRSLIACDCGGMMKQVLGVGVHIGAGALPTKKGELAKDNQREKALSQDLESYKRMRDRGLQPRSTEGARYVEDRVEDQTDIDRERVFSLDPTASRQSVKDRIEEGYAMAAQINAEAESA